MRNLVRDLTRWVRTPLLAVDLIAWVFAPAFSQGVGEKPGGPSQVGTLAGPQVNPAAPGKIQDLKDQIQRLEDRERHNYLLVLEGERKMMDWWFSFLAVVTTLLAFFGVLIPFFMGRKDKEIIEEDKRQIRETKSQIETHKLEIERHKERIEEYASMSQSKYGVITNAHDEILKKVNTAKEMEATEAQKIKETVKAVQDDRASDPSRGLRAEAIAASQSGDVERANSLWRALATLQPKDALVQFNAGYWAQDLAKKSKRPESVFWLRQAGEQYAEALRLKPDFHEAASSWADALLSEAGALPLQEGEQISLVAQPCRRSPSGPCQPGSRCGCLQPCLCLWPTWGCFSMFTLAEDMSDPRHLAGLCTSPNGPRSGRRERRAGIRRVASVRVSGVRENLRAQWGRDLRCDSVVVKGIIRHRSTHSR